MTTSPWNSLSCPFDQKEYNKKKRENKKLTDGVLDSRELGLIGLDSFVIIGFFLFYISVEFML